MIVDCGNSGITLAASSADAIPRKRQRTLTEMGLTGIPVFVEDTSQVDMIVNEFNTLYPGPRDRHDTFMHFMPSTIIGNKRQLTLHGTSLPPLEHSKHKTKKKLHVPATPFGTWKIDSKPDVWKLITSESHKRVRQRTLMFSSTTKDEGHDATEKELTNPRGTR